MVMAAHLSERLGLIDAAMVARLTAIISRAGLPVKGPQLNDPSGLSNADAYLSHMRVDKKAQAGDIRFVLIEAGGSAKIGVAEDALVREVIEACCDG